MKTEVVMYFLMLSPIGGILGFAVIRLTHQWYEAPYITMFHKIRDWLLFTIAITVVLFITFYDILKPVS